MVNVLETRQLLRLVIVSHAYIEEELRKGIGALAQKLQVTVVTPEISECLVFPSLRVRDSQEYIELFTPIRSALLFGSQYLFLSSDLGFRKSKPDVICVEYDPWSLMFWQTLIASRLFARKARIVCSVKKNTYRRAWGLNKIKYLMGRVSINHISRYITASEMTRRLYEDIFGIDRSKIDVFTHLGVDTDNFCPPPVGKGSDPREAVMGYAGRLEPHKGIEDLVEAADHCRATTDLNIRLEVCGGGSLKGHLEELAKSRPWLSIKGLVPNGEVPDFLRRLDLFVLPARTLPDHEEHDAHALLEALACGLPCIATRSGINAELLHDGIGVLVEPQQPLELSDAIAALVRDVARRLELASAARQRAVAEFDNHRLAARKVELFKEVACGQR